MPRLSLYKPEKGKDYEFLDKTIQEMFTVGGTDVFVHKYLGPKNPDEADATADQPRYDAVKETNIQDMLFMENRDRKYDPDVYVMRGIYNVQDVDFDMSQFGLFLQNDTLFMTLPINYSVKTLGRKIMSGDVLELPHLKDEHALNDYSVALKRFYVVEDVNRASEGFSQTWYPHLYRIKMKQIVDSQKSSKDLAYDRFENLQFKQKNPIVNLDELPFGKFLMQYLCNTQSIKSIINVFMPNVTSYRAYKTIFRPTQNANSHRKTNWQWHQDAKFHSTLNRWCNRNSQTNNKNYCL